MEHSSHVNALIPNLSALIFMLIFLSLELKTVFHLFFPFSLLLKHKKHRRHSCVQSIECMRMVSQCSGSMHRAVIKNSLAFFRYEDKTNAHQVCAIVQPFQCRTFKAHTPEVMKPTRMQTAP